MNDKIIITTNDFSDLSFEERCGASLAVKINQDEFGKVITFTVIKNRYAGVEGQSNVPIEFLSDFLKNPRGKLVTKWSSTQ